MIQVVDELGYLSTTSKAGLEATPVAFNVKVFISEDTRNSLETQMKDCATSRSSLCIGVNPTARFSAVYYGGDVAPAASVAEIKKAGNPSFRKGDVEQGVKDIILRAQSVSATARVVVQQPMQTIDHPVPVWPFVTGFGGLAVIIAAAVLIFRRQQRKAMKAVEDVQREAGELASRNIQADKDRELTERLLEKASKPVPPASESRQSSYFDQRRVVPAPAPDPSPPSRSYGSTTWGPSRPPTGYASVRPSPPAPIVVHQPPVVVRDNSNDLVTGMLVGEALSRPREREVIVEREEPRHHHRREATPEPTRSSWGASRDDDDDRSSSSSGGSSSFFDSSSDPGPDTSGGSSGFDD